MMECRSSRIPGWNWEGRTTETAHSENMEGKLQFVDAAKLGFSSNPNLSSPHRMNDTTEVSDPDAALMLRVKAGDETAFRELVERWKQPVMNFVHRIIPDRDEAEDLAQSVFVQLWRTAHRYEVTARFSTFLFTIARNLSLNELRRRSRHPVEALIGGDMAEEGEEGHRQLPDPTQRTADAALEEAELVSKVDEALADLPEKQRIALALCREGELSYEEIALVLGTTVSATKSLIHRAREVLKARLKPYLRTGVWERSNSNFPE